MIGCNLVPRAFPLNVTHLQGKSPWNEIGLDEKETPQGGYSKKFYSGRVRPEVQPTLLYTIFSEKAPLSYTFYWKKAPLSDTFL